MKASLYGKVRPSIEIGKNAVTFQVLKDEILLRATKSELDTVTGNLSTLSAEVSVQAGLIASKAEKATVDGIETRLNTAEQKITPEAITTTVRSSSEYTQDLNAKEATVIKQNTAPAHLNGRLWMDTSVTPNILKRSTGSAWVNASPTTAAQVGAYSASDGSALATRVTNAETSITQQAGEIALKASNETVTAMDSRLSSAELKITPSAITQTVRSSSEYTSDLNAKEGVVTKSNTAPAHLAGRLWLDTSVTPNILKRSTGTAWVNASPTTAAHVGAYSQADGTALATRVTSAETSISQTDEKIALSATRTEQYIQSRGQNLVTNGTGLLGNNTNFPSMTFDGSDNYASKGSFTRTGEWSYSESTEIMPVNPDLNYRFRYYAKGNPFVSGMRIYGYVVCYDSDGRSISPTHTMYYPNTLTTLATELKNGDTTVRLTSAANWNNGGGASNTHTRTLIFWNYRNDSGYLYPPMTYSRNVYSNSWNEGGINFSTNTITLRTAWTGGTIAAGTPLSNGSSGGSYKYIAGSNSLVAADWGPLEGTISGIDTTGTNVMNRFHPGTAGVRIGWITNVNGPGAKTWVSNISFQVDYEGDIKALDTRLQAAELKVEPDAITATVRSSTAYTQDLNAKEGAVIKQNTAPAHLNGRLWLDTSKSPNVLNRSTGSAWVAATPTTPGHVGAASPTDVSNAVAAINVGGRNLIARTKELTGYANRTDETYGGTNIARVIRSTTTGTSDVFSANMISVADSDEYVASFYAKAATATTISCFFYNPNTTTQGASSTGQTSSGSDGNTGVNITTEWKRYWVRWKQSNTTSIKTLLLGRFGGANTVWISGIKLEQGNKASDWTPAPEDIDATIGTLTNRVSDAELKILPDAITSTVTSHATYQNDVGNRVGTAIGNLKIGGNNLLRNTRFEADANGSVPGWTGNLVVRTEDFKGMNALEFSRTNFSSGGRAFMTSQIQNMEIKAGSKYAASAWVYVDSSVSIVSGSNVYLRIHRGAPFDDFELANLVALPKDQWVYVSTTFTLAQDATLSTANVFGVALAQNGRVRLAMPKVELGSLPTDWTPAMEDTNATIDSINTWITNAEQKIEPDQIAANVMSVQSFQDLMATKASADELADLVTAEQLNEARLALEEYARDAVGTVNLDDYVTSTSLTQTTNAINLRISSAGGVNLLQNSVGWTGIDFWAATSSNWRVVKGTSELDGLGAGSAWQLNLTTITQDVPVVAGETYTFSCYVNKAAGQNGGHFDCDEGNGTFLRKATYLTGAGYAWSLFTYTFTAVGSNARIRIIQVGASSALITNVMLNKGPLRMQWTHAKNEIYNSNVRFDLNGIVVQNNATNGETRITPTEFAGYAQDETGGMERIFTLNGDTTEVKKLRAAEEFTMGPVRILQIESGDINGWAFLPRD